MIPCVYTQYCGNVFPGLNWTQGPTDTRSYVLIVRGGNPGHGLKPIFFTVFNIPAGLSRLRRGLSTAPAGASLGPNVHGPHHTYVGPHPHTTAMNTYRFQVFDLGTRVQPRRPVTLTSLLAAMRGHVLASGELVGHAAKPTR